MILGGDEIGRTQGGNNNAYCQDNEVSWYDWADPDTELCRYISDVIGVRRDHPAFRRRQFFQGRSLHGEGAIDLAWFTPHGDEMGDEEWNQHDLKTLTIYLGGSSIEQSARGESVSDTNFLWLINGGHDPVTLTLPDEHWGTRWRVSIDSTTGEVSKPDAEVFEASAKIELIDHATVLLEHVDDE